MGHLVGLHVDSALFSEEEDKIKGTIDWIRDNLFLMDYVVSFHRPEKEILGKNIPIYLRIRCKIFNWRSYVLIQREDKFYDKLENL